MNDPQEQAGSEERAGGEAPAGSEARPPGSEARPGLRGRLPDITWSIKDTIWGLIAGLILALIAPIVVVPFDPDLSSDGALLAAQGVFGLCLLGVPLAVASGWDPSKIRVAFERLGLRRFALSALGWMLLALFLYYLFAGLFSSLVLEPKQDDIAEDLGIGDESVVVAVAAVVLIVGLAAISEEMFFRGFVFSGLRSRMTVWPAAVISGLVFGLVHAPTGITTVIPLAVLGAVLAWLYDRTGSLWPSVIAHALNNALALAILSSDSGFVGL
jgi:membrane protease YdiL (CAAX protease family)